MPERIGRLLMLIQVLIGYGKEVAATLRQQAVTPQLRLTLQTRFGTSELARILGRIGRALRLAGVLEHALRRQAATGQDVMTHAEVAQAQPAASRGNRTTTGADRRSAEDAADPDDQSEDDLFSEAEIVAMVRDGKLGILIEQICRDLGLVPAVVSEQQWSEVHHAIITYGGNFARLIGDACIRASTCVYQASFTQPLTQQAIAALNEAIFGRPAPA